MCNYVKSMIHLSVNWVIISILSSGIYCASTKLQNADADIVDKTLDGMMSADYDKVIEGIYELCTNDLSEFETKITEKRNEKLQKEFGSVCANVSSFEDKFGTTIKASTEAGAQFLTDFESTTTAFMDEYDQIMSKIAEKYSKSPNFTIPRASGMKVVSNLVVNKFAEWVWSYVSKSIWPDRHRSAAELIPQDLKEIDDYDDTVPQHVARLFAHLAVEEEVQNMDIRLFTIVETAIWDKVLNSSSIEETWLFKVGSLLDTEDRTSMYRLNALRLFITFLEYQE